MNRIKILRVPVLVLLFLVFAGPAFGTNEDDIKSIIEVQQYNRAIHIMAMLLVGFGFLMVFVKKYGRSALTATFLLVSTALPLYFAISDSGLFSEPGGEIKTLILAEFGAASLLIAAGAILGRVKMYEYLILGLLFIPFYMLNEWAVAENGFGLVNGGFADTGGSVVIHAFGAIFGIAAAFSLTTKRELETPINANATSDRYSMLGSMILWLFWPSFCAALVPTAEIPHAVVNVFLALSGSTIITYILSVSVRGKINIADIANAALAGGVAIGSTFDHVSHGGAILIGAIAGGISTLGFALLQERQKKVFKSVDTCGVTNLHGLPGLFGGLAAIFVVDDLSAGSQLSGIGITIIIAATSGIIAGKIISLFGRRKEPYIDSEEFEDA
ncbi:MAG: ammonium transporter [Bacteroidales bacterium]|nr:ammonium transporter [Bacteroidales bacterium]